MTDKAAAKKKAPAKKKAAAKKAPAKKPAAPKATPKPEEAVASPTPATTFKEIRSWADCKGKVVQLWHPAVGNGYHKAKVLSVNVTEGTLLASIATDGIKGRYLLPLDSLVGKVK